MSNELDKTELLPCPHKNLLKGAGESRCQDCGAFVSSKSADVRTQKMSATGALACWSCGHEAEARDDIHARCLNSECEASFKWFTRKTWNTRAVTHPDATTEWISPHSPSDCQVTCPVHLRWADEVKAYMGPDYIRTQALEEAAKVIKKHTDCELRPQLVREAVIGYHLAAREILAAIRALLPSTPCPDCEQARATNDTPGFFYDKCEKHRASASVPAEMTKEEMQHEANFLKLQEMLSDGTISRFEYERGLEQNDAEFRATLPAPTAQEEAEVPASNKWTLDDARAVYAAFEGQCMEMNEARLTTALGVALGVALSATTATQGVVQLLDAALVHPESAEGHIRQVIEMLSVRARLSSESGKAPYIGTCQKCRKVSEYMMHGWCSECIYRLITVARSEQAQPDTPISELAEPHWSSDAAVLRVLVHNHHVDNHKGFPKETCPAWPCDLVRKNSVSISPERVDPEDQKLS